MNLLVVLLFSLVANADSQCDNEEVILELRNENDMLKNLVSQLDQGLLNVQADISNLKSKIPTLYYLTTNTGEDCDDIRARGHTTSGVFEVNDGNGQIKRVYCEMTSADNCAWTRILHRQDNLTDFVLKKWADYEAGFGDPQGSHWMGLIHMNKLTTNKAFKLRVDFEDWENNTKSAEYSTFRVGSASDMYRLSIDGYSGNAGDSLTFHNNMQFTTIDKDNDQWSAGNCADGTASHTGGWWYLWYSIICHESRLTGQYFTGGKVQSGHGIQWPTWRTAEYSYTLTTMKIQRLDCTA